MLLNNENNFGANPTLSSVTIFPVKSLDGVALQKAMITEGGCLLHDREYAITDDAGNFIIGKSNPLVHSLRSTIDFKNEVISFRHQQEATWNQFHLQKEKLAIQSYLTKFFGIPALFHQNKTGRFMDIPDISGVTVLSTASLQSVSEWFDNIDLKETRKRFRATLEIEGVPAFWEDHLFSKEGASIEFRIGDVTLFGMSPRARCVVPSRNPETGEVIHAFPKSFARHRAAALPEFSTLPEYGHYYHLTVNCHIPATETGKWMYADDEIKIIGEKVFY
ncbi:MAG: MOSC N-terminal beta barrel domain-containing protein [Parafilimonas sp.]